MEKLIFAKVKPNAIIPTKREADAGRDMYACFDEDYMIIYPNTTVLVPTGIATAFSKDYYLQIQERGSTGSKGIKYGAGVVDSNYRGEIFIALTNCNEVPVIIAKDEKQAEELFPFTKKIIYPYSKGIAQFVMLPVPKFEEVEIPYEELLKIESERGTGALGSSGK